MLFGASRHVVSLIRSPIMPDAIWCIPTRGITYYNSVSHHDAVLVHHDTWYHLFGLPSCRMLFGASRHVVLLITIRSPIMTDSVWCIPTRGINYYNSVSHHDGYRLVHPDTWYHLFGLPSFRMLFGASRHVVLLITIWSPIMTDVVWCIPTRGINYYNSVSHHDGCRLVHPDTWYHLFGLPSCRMLFGASRHVVLLITIRSSIMTDVVWCIPTRGITYSVSHHARCYLVHPDTWYQLNAIHHQDGYRLVHPAKWDISSMSYAIMTDADWCIPPSGTLENFRVPS